MAADNIWTWAVWGPVLITLISGTVSSLGNKVAYQTPIEGTCGKNDFSKAYFFTLCMFIGEALCLLLYFIKEQIRKRRERAAKTSGSYSQLGGRLSPDISAVNNPSSFNVSDSSLLPAGDAAPVKKPPIWVYAILCVFDLSATSVSGVGLIWVDASLNQMLRGSMVVFCAIFSVLMLKRRLNKGQWASIGLVCIGLALVGMSGMLKKHYEKDSGDDSSQKVTSGQMLIGILLILLGSALNAVQNVFEEKLLKAVGGAEVDPLELVGWEGVFGTILAAFVLLPIVQHIPGDDCGKAEDTLNTLKQLGNSGLAIGMSLSFVFGLMLMNWTSQQISQQLSSVHRNLVSAVRTVLVWIGSLILYYTTSHTGNKDDADYGEQWTNWSFMELGGFVVLVGGTVLYSYAGIQAARAQEALEVLRGEFANSPDYVLPIEPQLGEHQQIVKQQSFSNKMHHAGAYQAEL